MNPRKKLAFWGAHEDDDSLVLNVIAGRKTVTADTVEDYYKDYGELGDGGYAAGDLIDVYDLRDRPRCTIRATEVPLSASAISRKTPGATKRFRARTNSVKSISAACRTWTWMTTSNS